MMLIKYLFKEINTSLSLRFVNERAFSGAIVNRKVEIAIDQTVSE